MRPISAGLEEGRHQNWELWSGVSHGQELRVIPGTESGPG